jgi:mono/diheme cytochrome c family protein
MNVPRRHRPKQGFKRRGSATFRKFRPQRDGAARSGVLSGIRMKATFRALLVLLVLCAFVAGLAGYSVMRRGISARTEPSGVETIVARGMRTLATPRAVRERPNPVAKSPEVMDSALQHYADHCAVCHANDGSGDTAIGRGLYPKAPDRRAIATQSLTDGELFSIIENGIRLTGMPAWGTGTPEGERDSWALVHFIRRLPSLTPEEIERMEALNPKSPAEFKEEEEMRRFLEGEPTASTSPAGSPPAASPHQKHRD